MTKNKLNYTIYLYTRLGIFNIIIMATLKLNTTYNPHYPHSIFMQYATILEDIRKKI